MPPMKPMMAGKQMAMRQPVVCGAGRASIAPAQPRSGAMAYGKAFPISAAPGQMKTPEQQNSMLQARSDFAAGKTMQQAELEKKQRAFFSQGNKPVPGVTLGSEAKIKESSDSTNSVDTSEIAMLVANSMDDILRVMMRSKLK